jgi:two-component system CheB/CheR fusion protein
MSAKETSLKRQSSSQHPETATGRFDDQTETSGKALNRKPNARLTVVGIGASAGGVEALERLFSEMPESTGMAFVIVQHLAPDFQSLMHQIIGRRTSMPVSQIEDGMMLEPDHVYVCPNGVSAEVSGLRLVARDQGGERQHNPIDSFFHSLAIHHHKNAVAVVLSGTGSDGAAGIKSIHESLGLVVVQSEASAKFNGMPRAAIATGVVDAIVPVEEIPEALARFGELTSDASGKSRQAVFAESMDTEKRIHHLLHRKFGIDFDQYRNGMFGRGLATRVLLSKSAGTETYLQKLESDDAELRKLYDDLLIGVTEFFRDSQAFNKLQHSVLPQLIESASKTKTLHIWIAPCATGEEAYSIAILIDELVKQRNYDIDVKIFATDVNQACIDAASRGLYTRDRVANVSPTRLAEYFSELDDDKFQVIPRLRRQIVFAKQNVLNDAPFTKLDLVCCRNLLIYFKPEAKKKALSLFNFSLKKSGVLFLGPSETVSELEQAFEPICEKWRIYEKNASVRFSQVNMRIGTPNNLAAQITKGADSDEKDKELSAVYDALLSAYLPPSFLIDGENRILHVFGNAVDYLVHRSGRPSDDLMELLPEGIRALAVNGLKRAKVEDRPSVFPGIEFKNPAGESHTLQLAVVPVHNRFENKYLITVEKSEPVSPSSLLPDISDICESVDGTIIETLEKELQETRESLHESILNLKSANEEMQTTNEELIASNEELQSTNEELHSVNEELYTVNSEFQRKITELTELTDDMDNLLDCLQIDTIYLDRHLRVRKFTLGSANIFRLLPQDVGRDFESFNHELQHDDIIASIKAVLATEQPCDEEVSDKNGNWYLMRLLPYSSRGQVDGVLLTLIDITTMKATEQRLFELSEIVQSSNDAIFRVSESGEIKTWNRGARDLFLHETENIIGKNIDLLSLDEHGERKVASALGQIRHGVPINHVELKAVRRNGEEFDVQSTISAIYKSDGQLDGASIVLRDITVQKKAEAQIREQVRRRDHFLAVLSHELRNPTAAITNALSVVRKQELPEGNLKRAIDIIQQQSNQVSKMLDDLLHFSRVAHDKFKLQLETVDICRLTRQLVQSLEHRFKAKHQSLTLELPSEPIYAFVDETRIVQAQTNLLVNASKYTQEYGKITLSIRSDNNNVIVEVSDDGEGISSDLLERVFDVFVQADQPLDRSSGGMGLGLPLVKMIAHAHGGEVEVHSKGMGCGSIVKLKFPIGGVVLRDTAPKTPDSRDCLLGVRLLLVEDNDGAREMLAEFLEMEGLEVATAINGIEAVESFEKLLPEICVVDIGLPDMNGYDVAKRIRGLTEKTILVALTGYGQEKDQELVKNAGFDLHLVKPMDPEQLVATLVRKFGSKLRSAADGRLKN